MQSTDTHELPEKVASRIDRSDADGCWQWIGACMRTGYGQFTIKRRHYLAHRVVYELLVEPIRPGMFIDHRCFNRSCVNPAHLRQVTNKQNMEHLRGPNRDSTTGVRNVSMDKRSGKYRVQVGHDGRVYYGGTFSNIADAEVVAIAMRARYFTHDDGVL